MSVTGAVWRQSWIPKGLGEGLGEGLGGGLGEGLGGCPLGGGSSFCGNFPNPILDLSVQCPLLLICFVFSTWSVLMQNIWFYLEH